MEIHFAQTLEKVCVETVEGLRILHCKFDTFWGFVFKHLIQLL